MERRSVSTPLPSVVGVRGCYPGGMDLTRAVPTAMRRIAKMKDGAGDVRRSLQSEGERRLRRTRRPHRERGGERT